MIVQTTWSGLEVCKKQHVMALFTDIQEKILQTTYFSSKVWLLRCYASFLWWKIKLSIREMICQQDDARRNGVLDKQEPDLIRGQISAAASLQNVLRPCSHYQLKSNDLVLDVFVLHVNPRPHTHSPTGSASQSISSHQVTHHFNGHTHTSAPWARQELKP